MDILYIRHLHKGFASATTLFLPLVAETATQVHFSLRDIRLAFKGKSLASPEIVAGRE